ncbi:MAG: hypothetical protein IIT71_05590 [Acetobacter sp.]|nr:hypothetical protein [Acetobacter sp.]MBQ5773620.1 hypothetical protein [Acetobacter sp.]
MVDCPIFSCPTARRNARERARERFYFLISAIEGCFAQSELDPPMIERCAIDYIVQRDKAALYAFNPDRPNRL